MREYTFPHDIIKLFVDFRRLCIYVKYYVSAVKLRLSMESSILTTNYSLPLKY
jgi:hypothetical protein